MDIENITLCPERDEYKQFINNKDNWEKENFAKTKKVLLEKYKLAFHNYVAEVYPYLKYEKTNDKVYFNYNERSGVYEELSFAEVRSLVIKLLIDEDLVASATEAFAKNVLNKYRASFQENGVQLNEFDVHDNLFHAKNGWLNLETRVLEPHTPERLSRRVSGVVYDPKATCDTFDAFMDVESHLNKDVVRMIDQFGGHLLDPRRKIKKALIFEGRPGCGKSMIPEIWSLVLGTMASTLNLSEVGGDHSHFNRDMLDGKNFCFVDEASPKTKDINETFQTMITSPTFEIFRKGIQGKTTANNNVRFVLSLNEMPDHMPSGMDRRYRHVMFQRSFFDEGIEDDSVSRQIKEKELSGVLNRMLKGYDDFNKMGDLVSTAGETEYKRDYILAADDQSAFLAEHFEPANDNEVRYTFREMRAAFVAEFPKSYNKQLSIQAFNKKLLSNRLPEFSKIKKGRRTTGGGRGYIGIKLKKGHSFPAEDYEPIQIEHIKTESW